MVVRVDMRPEKVGGVDHREFRVARTGRRPRFPGGRPTRRRARGDGTEKTPS
jgi:hypothetical protein